MTEEKDRYRAPTTLQAAQPAAIPAGTSDRKPIQRTSPRNPYTGRHVYPARTWPGQKGPEQQERVVRRGCPARGERPSRPAPGVSAVRRPGEPFAPHPLAAQAEPASFPAPGAVPSGGTAPPAGNGVSAARRPRAFPSSLTPT
jgi:hypothetical protein